MNAAPVLLPGNMCDARLWRGEEGVIVDALERRLGRPVYDADLSRDDSIAAMAARTLETTSGPLLAIGFSMGAIVAVEMWCQAPERIAGLVLLGYNATADLPERAAHRPRQQAAVRAGDLKRVLVDELKPNYLAAAHRHDRALLNLLCDMGMALGPEVFVRQSEALRLRADRRDALARFDIPVLYGCGDEDTLCPPDWHRAWAAQTRGARIELFPGAGHMLPLEAARPLEHTIDLWIAEHQKDLAA